MAFPTAPTDSQLHTEGDVEFIYRAALGAWDINGGSGSSSLCSLTVVDRATTEIDLLNEQVPTCYDGTTEQSRTMDDLYTFIRDRLASEATFQTLAQIKALISNLGSPNFSLQEIFTSTTATGAGIGTDGSLMLPAITSGGDPAVAWYVIQVTGDNPATVDDGLPAVGYHASGALFTFPAPAFTDPDYNGTVQAVPITA